MRVVAALGGNALLRRGEPLEEDVQRDNVKDAVRALGPIAREHQLIVTHGNGPQVGLLALESEAYQGVTPYGLDLLGAESQGMVGFLLEEAFRSEIPDRRVATVLTSVLVDEADPAFGLPTKAIGPAYSEADARVLAQARGWNIAADGKLFRRVVASPEPRRILELEAIRLLVEAGVIVICAGGGGIPVVQGVDGSLRGVGAVMDKDMTAALLAETLGADVLLLLTDVTCVEAGWGTHDAWPIHEATPDALRRLQFAGGSMAPKVEAACRFVERTGGRAAIGAMRDAFDLLEGRTGTAIRREAAPAAGANWRSKTTETR